MPDKDQRVDEYASLFRNLIDKADERKITFREIAGSRGERYEVLEGGQVVATTSDNWKERFEKAMLDGQIVDAIEKRQTESARKLDFIDKMRLIEEIYNEREKNN